MIGKMENLAFPGQKVSACEMGKKYDGTVSGTLMRQKNKNELSLNIYCMNKKTYVHF